MYDLLFKQINKKVQLTEGEMEFCKTVFIPKKLRRKQFLLQEGDVCRYTAFVNKGCLRQYTIDKKGGEHIVQFAIEDWWIGDMYSSLTGEPSTYNIDTLEESELLLFDTKNRDLLLERIPKFEKFFRILLEGHHIATHRRIIGAMSQTAEERFVTFSKTYPKIIQRVPQHMVASYLGLTPETLSRIRNKIVRKK
jgi:CRP-like cAMP-binding protein